MAGGNGKWRVQVRRNGLPPQSRNFETHEAARKWAAQLEGRIAADDFVDLSEAKRTTLGEALTRYLAEVTPGKKVRSSSPLHAAGKPPHQIGASMTI